MTDYKSEFHMNQGSQAYGIGRSLRLVGNDYRKFHWNFDADVMDTPGGFLNPKDVCNFAKSTPRSAGRDTACIMCGANDVSIPSQNKKVCKNCDSSFWLWMRHQVVFKFCKGCKNFCFLADFDDRPEGTKCTKCRQRSRDWYHSKKGSDDNVSPNGSCEDNHHCSPHSSLPTPVTSGHHHHHHHHVPDSLARSMSTSALPDDLLPPPVPTLVTSDVLVAKLVRKRSLSALEDIAHDALRSVHHRPYKKLVFSPVANTNNGEHAFVTPGNDNSNHNKDNCTTTNDTDTSMNNNSNNSGSEKKRHGHTPGDSKRTNSAFFPAIPATTTAINVNNNHVIPLFSTPYHDYHHFPQPHNKLLSHNNSSGNASGTTTTASSSGSKILSLSAFSATNSNTANGFNTGMNSTNTSTGGYPMYPLHQVTPEGYPILLPPTSLATAASYNHSSHQGHHQSSSVKKQQRAKKSTPTNNNHSASKTQWTPLQEAADAEYRLHRLPAAQLLTTFNATMNYQPADKKDADPYNRSQQQQQEEEEEDAEVERLTSETFDRLISSDHRTNDKNTAVATAAAAAAGNNDAHHSEDAAAAAAAEGHLLLLQAHSLLLSCRNSSTTHNSTTTTNNNNNNNNSTASNSTHGLPPRLLLPLQTQSFAHHNSTNSTYSHTNSYNNSYTNSYTNSFNNSAATSSNNSVSANEDVTMMMSRPSTACSLTYSAASSPSQQDLYPRSSSSHHHHGSMMDELDTTMPKNSSTADVGEEKENVPCNGSSHHNRSSSVNSGYSSNSSNSSVSVSRTHSPLHQQHTTTTTTAAAVAATTDSSNHVLMSDQQQKTKVRGIAMVNQDTPNTLHIVSIINTIHNTTTTATADKLDNKNSKDNNDCNNTSMKEEAGETAPHWQYDPKHNPLALLANFSDDIF